MAVDLFFRAPLNTTQPVDLLFGAEDTPNPLPGVTFAVTLAAPFASIALNAQDTLALVASLAAPTAVVLLAAQESITIGLQLAGVSCSIVMGYDDNLQAGPSRVASAAWQRAAPMPRVVESIDRQAATLQAARGAPWGTGTPRGRFLVPGWQAMRAAARRTDAVWQQAQARGATAPSTWQAMTPRRRSSRATWQQATASDPDVRGVIWQEMTRRQAQHLDGWQEARAIGIELRLPTRKGRPAQRSTRIPWEEGRVPPPGRSARPTPPVPPIGHLCYTPPLGSAVELLFAQLQDGRTRLLFVCDGDLIAALVRIPVRRVYMVSNNVTLVRVDTGAEIKALSVTLTGDVDSWTWGFSASVPLASQADVEPNSNGDPVELVLAVNGAPYRVIVRSLSRSRQFPGGSVSVQGTGRGALLDAPFAAVRSFANDQDRTAQQLMADVLTDNGQSIGWDVDWGLDDWTVPAGAFVQQATYANALDAIAKAAGGYLQPHATDQTLIVLPRYPVAPWEWNTVAPDIELPSAVVTREGIDWTDKPLYNRVFVSGSSAGGVLGQVTRAGTAGDLAAPMVVDPLLTDAIAARQRGLSILSDTGRQALVSLRLPVLALTGVIRPGKFVRYVDGSTTRMGLVRSVSVEAATTTAWQTIGVETHE